MRFRVVQAPVHEVSEPTVADAGRYLGSVLPVGTIAGARLQMLPLLRLLRHDVDHSAGARRRPVDDRAHRSNDVDALDDLRGKGVENAAREPGLFAARATAETRVALARNRNAIEKHETRGGPSDRKAILIPSALVPDEDRWRQLDRIHHILRARVLDLLYADLHQRLTGSGRDGKQTFPRPDHLDRNLRDFLRRGLFLLLLCHRGRLLRHRRSIFHHRGRLLRHCRSRALGFRLGGPQTRRAAREDSQNRNKTGQPSSGSHHQTPFPVASLH